MLVCVFVCQREEGRQGEKNRMKMFVLVCWEKGREKERARDRERERESEEIFICVCLLGREGGREGEMDFLNKSGIYERVMSRV